MTALTVYIFNWGGSFLQQTISLSSIHLIDGSLKGLKMFLVKLLLLTLFVLVASSANIHKYQEVLVKMADWTLALQSKAVAR